MIQFAILSKVKNVNIISKVLKIFNETQYERRIKSGKI